jgi:hypothetical protein
MALSVVPSSFLLYSRPVSAAEVGKLVSGKLFVRLLRTGWTCPLWPLFFTRYGRGLPWNSRLSVAAGYRLDLGALATEACCARDYVVVSMSSVPIRVLGSDQRHAAVTCGKATELRHVELLLSCLEW